MPLRSPESQLFNDTKIIKVRKNPFHEQFFLPNPILGTKYYYSLENYSSARLDNGCIFSEQIGLYLFPKNGIGTNQKRIAKFIGFLMILVPLERRFDENMIMNRSYAFSFVTIPVPLENCDRKLFNDTEIFDNNKV